MHAKLDAEAMIAEIVMKNVECGTHRWLPIPLIMPVSSNDHTRCSTFTSSPSLTAPPIPFLSLSLNLPTPTKLIFLLIMETHPYTSLRTFACATPKTEHHGVRLLKFHISERYHCWHWWNVYFSMGSLQLPLPTALIRRVRGWGVLGAAGRLGGFWGKRKKEKKRKKREKRGEHYSLGRFEAAVRDLCKEFFRENGVIFWITGLLIILFITGLPFFFIIGLSFFFITGLLIFLHHRAAHPS